MLVAAIGGLGIVVVAGWAGLQVEPRPLPAPDLEPGDLPTVAVPDGLPAPVARFYATLYGDRVPVVDTAVITGRGTMRIAGVTFPARWRFSHRTGEAYRHYIELTAYGRALTAVNERYVDQQARLELPFGVSEGPTIDQGANLALWAEAVWMPSVWVTDPDARWEPIDDDSARLIVPFAGGEETFTAQFDPDTGLLRSLTSMRFKGEEDRDKTLWINDVGEWGQVDAHPVPLRAEIEWADEDSPWARLRTENVRYNVDLGDYLTVRGP